MNMRKKMIPMAALAALLVMSGAAHAAGDREMCESAKLKASGKFTSCHLGTDAKAQTKGEAAVYTKCDDSQASSFTKAEDKYGLDCPTTGDATPVNASLDSISSCVAGKLAGDGADCSLASQGLCGNGIVDPGEVCDQGAMNGGSCSSATGGVKPQGTLTCGADCTSYDTSACVKCPASQATLYGGKCWMLASLGQSCTDVCVSAGLAYDTATETVAGSSGTLAHCAGILARLQNTGTSAIEDSSLNPGVGCYQFLLGSFRRDLAGPADANSTYTLGRRACACS